MHDTMNKALSFSRSVVWREWDCPKGEKKSSPNSESAGAEQFPNAAELKLIKVAEHSG